MTVHIKQDGSRITVHVREAFRQLIPGFLARRRGDTRSLARSVENQDFETIAGIGHMMRGNGDSMGFAEISRIGVALEDAAAREDGIAVDVEVERLRNYLDRVDVEYD